MYFSEKYATGEYSSQRKVDVSEYNTCIGRIASSVIKYENNQYRKFTVRIATRCSSLL